MAAGIKAFLSIVSSDSPWPSATAELDERSPELLLLLSEPRGAAAKPLWQGRSRAVSPRSPALLGTAWGWHCRLGLAQLLG